jgi:hypothetical protein
MVGDIQCAIVVERNFLWAIKGCHCQRSIVISKIAADNCCHITSVRPEASGFLLLFRSSEKEETKSLKKICNQK